jgi:hypothetical protein
LDIAKRASVLISTLNKFSRFRNLVTGVDAAASEFDAPPEVFAPVYRKMRRAGIRHFTYHAGEDFYHIIGGMRAIYEAITFCNLKEGDRIGHAVASGVAPSLWLSMAGKTILVHQGQYLDDLVFARHLIIHEELSQLFGKLPLIESKITDLFSQVYQQTAAQQIIEQAWLMRQCCPLTVIEKSDNILIYDPSEERLPLEKKFVQTSATLNLCEELFKCYHDKRYMESYKKIVEIETTADFSEDEMCILQKGVLTFMANKNIVIETLPTSNIRIGLHRDYQTYHLYNWLQLKKQNVKIPVIVVGSDDTGIFATSIFNEFGNIYECLIQHPDFSQEQVMDVIKKIDEASRLYRFDNVFIPVQNY